jgi:hypothetical protein
MNILIKKPNSDFELAKINNSFEEYKKILGGYVELIPFYKKITILVNEEGRLLDLPFNIGVNNIPIYGNMIFVSRKKSDFTSLTKRQINQIKKLYQNRSE